MSLILNDIKNLATGNIVSRAVDPTMQAAADLYNELSARYRWVLGGAVVLTGFAGTVFAWLRINPALKARLT